MERNLSARVPCWLCWHTAFLLFGCWSDCLANGAAEIAAHRTRLQIAQPRQAEHVLGVQKRFLADKRNPAAPKTREVVVVGQIGGMPNIWPETHPDFPWYEGQASFFLVDRKVAEKFAAHARHHGGQECAFCRQLAAKNVNAIAVVNLVDENGEILRVDARKLLDLKERETVVVRGRAKLLAGAMLVIDATGVHVSR